MKIRLFLSLLLLSMLLPPVKGQTQDLEFITLPDKIVEGTDADIMIIATDQGNPLPFISREISVTSSDPSIIEVKGIKPTEINNALIMHVHAGRVGNATLTAIAENTNPITTSLQVYPAADKVAGIILKSTPSSFSHLGPSKGYLSVQLVNSNGDPVQADTDYIIDLSSSHQSVVYLDKQIMIKKGEYFAIEEFTVKGSGMTMIRAEMEGKVAETKITVSKPLLPLKLKLYIAPQIAPALKGQTLYAFVQLQDSNGDPVVADNDLSINLISDTADIKGANIVIKKGESLAMGTLSANIDKTCSSINIDLAPANPNFTPCVEVIAVTDKLQSEPALVEFREYMLGNEQSVGKRIDDPDYVRIDPIILPADISSASNIVPSSIPIIADGKEKLIGVIQLMKHVDNDNDGNIDLGSAKPVLPSADTTVLIKTSDALMLDINKVIVPRFTTAIPFVGNVGYKGGEVKLSTLAEFFGRSSATINLYGHSNITLKIEPAVSKVAAGMKFPYVAYFIDSKGMASYAIDDTNLLASTNNIITIEPAAIRKGMDRVTILNARAVESGEGTVSVEGLAGETLLSASSKVNVIDVKPASIEISVPNIMLGNSRYPAALQLLDNNGIPIRAPKDIDIRLVSSNKSIVSVPDHVLLPKDKYSAIFLIESKGEGVAQINAFADGFTSIKRDVTVILPSLDLKLTSSDDLIKVNNEFTVSLSSTYKGMPIKDLDIKWSSNKATILTYDNRTDSEGRAVAKYIATDRVLGNITIKALVSGTGFESSEVELDLRMKDDTKKIVDDNNISISDKNTTSIENIDQNTMPLDLPIDTKYFIMIPAIVGAAIWFVKNKKGMHRSK